MQVKDTRGEELDRVTEQASGQEERNEWEWKQTKVGAGGKQEKTMRNRWCSIPLLLRYPYTPYSVRTGK